MYKLKLKGMVTAFSFALMSHLGIAQSLQPETVTMIKNITPGAHLYVHGGRKISVIDANSFKYQGSIPVPGREKSVISPDGKTMYVANIYVSDRIGGGRQDVLEQWDISTLSPIGEKDLPINKISMRGPDRALISLSSNNKWLFIQNATPATSVSTFDINKNDFGSEIPLPGCWGVYPVQGADKFVALCGDGRLSTVSIKSDGSSAGIERSDKIFDVEQDPLFTDYQRIGNELLMVSFNGNFYRIDISGKTAKLLEKTSLNSGVSGGWKPSGMQPLALVPNSKILYVLMRKNSKDGDHVEPANEIWAYDIEKKKVISRSSTNNALTLAYYSGVVPKLFVGMKDTGVASYVVSPDLGYSVRLDETMKLDGFGGLQVH